MGRERKKGNGTFQQEYGRNMGARKRFERGSGAGEGQPRVGGGQAEKVRGC